MLFQVRRHVLPRWGSKPLRSVKVGDAAVLTADLDRAGYAPDTRRLVLLAVRKMLLAAEADKEILAGIAAKIRLPRSRDDGEIKPTPHTEDVAGLLAVARASEHPCAILVLIAARTGLRRSELVGLRWAELTNDAHLAVRRSVNFVDGSAHLSPINKRQARAVRLPASLIADLKTLRRRHRFARISPRTPARPASRCTLSG